GFPLGPRLWYLNVRVLPTIRLSSRQYWSRCCWLNPVPTSNSTSPHLTVNFPKVSIPCILALWELLSVYPSSFVTASFALCMSSWASMTTASASKKRFSFKRMPSLVVERPNLYGPSMLRTMTPSHPSARHLASNSRSSSSSWTIVCCTCSRRSSLPLWASNHSRSVVSLSTYFCVGIA